MTHNRHRQVINLNRFLSALTLLTFLFIAPTAQAAKRIEIHKFPSEKDTTNKNNQAVSKPLQPLISIGEIIAEQTKYGLLLIPKLHSLPPGPHGFHIHTYGNCDNNGQAAGGHLDPKETNQHKGPYDDSGHLGDLPVLYVDKNGNATIPVLAPRLELSEIQGHSVIIHAGSDNYSDDPHPLGGGGGRLACGVASFILSE